MVSNLFWLFERFLWEHWDIKKLWDKNILKINKLKVKKEDAQLGSLMTYKTTEPTPPKKTGKKT